jgi:spore maturation protein CgeB
MVTSYCPDASAATELLFDAAVGLRVFYDLDTPVTLASLDAGQDVAYVPGNGFEDFDLVLSFTGGKALDALKYRLHAPNVAPLYGSVDPEVHRPVAPKAEFVSDLSYLGTYSADRQRALEQLFIEPASRCQQARFLLGGSQYPADFPWKPNLFYLPHVAPPEHPAFFCSSPLTVNVTRAPMVQYGHCPSGRLFEAAACGTPVLSDRWPGMEAFFEPGSEVLLSSSIEETLEHLSRPRTELARIGAAARRRALAEHSGFTRAGELVRLLSGAVPSIRPSEPTGPSSPAAVQLSPQEMSQCGE